MRNARESRRGGLASLSELQGTWDLTRVIRHGDGREDHFSGRAEFRPDGDSLVMVERGQLQTGGQMLEAEQRTIWAEAPGRIDIFFADGRDFHGFDLGEAQPEALHHCDPDLYHVRYDFSQWPQWQALWWVTGPRKDYVMRSDYRRGGE